MLTDSESVFANLGVTETLEESNFEVAKWENAGQSWNVLRTQESRF